MQKEHVVTIAAPYLTLILGAIIPFLTGLIAKKMASSAIKAGCTAILSAAAGIFSAAQMDGPIKLESAVVNVFVAFIAAITLYHGLYKPIGAANAVQSIAPNVGVG